jgi:hypothetical protein
MDDPSCSRQCLSQGHYTRHAGSRVPASRTDGGRCGQPDDREPHSVQTTRVASRLGGERRLASKIRLPQDDEERGDDDREQKIAQEYMGEALRQGAADVRIPPVQGTDPKFRRRTPPRARPRS